MKLTLGNWSAGTERPGTERPGTERHGGHGAARGALPRTDRGSHRLRSSRPGPPSLRRTLAYRRSLRCLSRSTTNVCCRGKSLGLPGKQTRKATIVVRCGREVIAALCMPADDTTLERKHSVTKHGILRYREHLGYLLFLPDGLGLGPGLRFPPLSSSRLRAAHFACTSPAPDPKATKFKQQRRNHGRPTEC
jgi:hypothetical protein